MSDKDSLGLYRLLGVATDATQEQIKAAYRTKVLEFHPDRNLDRDTTSEFQAIQAAYEVLSDEALREQYDADSAASQSAGRDEAGNPKPLEPIVCSRCNAITAQPRFKVFYVVYGYVFGAHKGTRHGIFCANCEIKEALKASATTLLLGWWSIWGFIWTIQVLMQNLVGGRFDGQNGRLQGYQALYFAQNGKLELAGAIAAQALKLAKKAQAESVRNAFARGQNLQNDTAQLHSLVDVLTDFIGELPADKRNGRLKHTAEVFNRRFAYQLLLLLIFISGVSGMIYLDEIRKQDNERIRLEKLGMENAKAEAIASAQAEELRKLEKPLPTNGLFRVANFIRYDPDRSPPLKLTGSSDSHTLMKLIRVVDDLEVISIFVRAGQTVEVGIPVGTYKAKIATGQTWYGDQVRFGPKTGYAVLDTVQEFTIEGNQLLGREIRLTLARDGNLTQSSLSASEF